MVFKINIGARIKRHSRILKDNILNDNHLSRASKKMKFGYKFVFLIMVFIVPIYPTLSSIIHNNKVLDFYRWDIDESSIIWYYFWDVRKSDEYIPILESKDSFLSINTLLNWDRDLSGINEIINYEVKPNESVSSIAYKFKISNQSIYDNNNFSKEHIIHPWDIIKIPPVSWLIHKIENGETTSSIAKKYNVDPLKIEKQNLLTSKEDLIPWDVLIIPWAVKNYKKNFYSKPLYTKSGTNKWWYSFSKLTNSEYANTKWVYNLVWKGKRIDFPWWNCTRYVAEYKSVDWRWNAKDWLKNAKAKWHPTWNRASVWSIIVFYGRGYNPWYGHVWIVMDVKDKHLIVNDMNYRRLWEVTYRKVPINDRAIRWYIYVD